MTNDDERILNVNTWKWLKFGIYVGIYVYSAVLKQGVLKSVPKGDKMGVQSLTQEKIFKIIEIFKINMKS